MSRFTQAFAAALLWLASPVSFAQPASQPVQHTIEVRLIPASGEVLIKDSLVVTQREHYRFRLASWLVIESLAVDGAPASALRQDYDYVVRLPDAGRHRLDFVLRGVVPPRDDAQQASAAMLSSRGGDGVYLPGYDAWIPHDGSESITYRLQVEVPTTQRAVATGRLVSEQSGDQSYQAVFEVTQPAEAPSLFAGPYQVSERRIKSAHDHQITHTRKRATEHFSRLL